MMRPLIIVIASCTLLSCQPQLPTDGMARRNNSYAAPPAGAPLKISCLNVGQGDATLISASPTENMLIDAGPPGAGAAVVLPYLNEEGIAALKYIVATHYHTDHIGGIPEVVKGEDGTAGTPDDIIPTHGFIDRGGTHEGTFYEEYEKAAAGERITAHPGDVYYVGDAAVEVVAANGRFADGDEIFRDETFDENSAGLALLVANGDFTYLHAADITGGGGNPPYETADVETHLGELVGDIDVLRVAHHGSLTSTNEDFLTSTDPEAAIISLGDGNDFGHPHDEVIDRLLNTGAEIYLTEQGWLDHQFLEDENIHITYGPVILNVQGEEWTIE